MKNKYLILGMTVIIIFTAITYHKATTKAEVVQGRTCEIGIFPYNPTAPNDTVNDEGDQHIKVVECGSHLSYPNTYNPQPPDPEENQIKLGSEGIRAPIAKHEYAYFNISTPNTRTNPYYFKTLIDKFEIKIHWDGVSNLDTNRLICDPPIPKGYYDARALQTGSTREEVKAEVVARLGSCQGQIDDVNYFGGVTSTVSEPGTDGSITITWDFGTATNNNILALVWGNNGENFRTPDGLFISDIQKFQANLNIRTKDNVATEAWSATSSSRILMAEKAIKISNYDSNRGIGCYNNNINDSRSGWCFLNPQAAPQTVTAIDNNGISHAYNDFYWYPIGTKATIWKKPPLPKLTLVKNVINDDGGTLGVANFPLFINENRATSGTANTLPPGNYTASETSSSSYTASVWGVDCATNGTVTLNYGDNKTCTITNTYIPPPPPPAEICNSITVSPSNFDTTTTATQRFQITVNPPTYTGLFRWQLNNPWQTAQLTPSDTTLNTVLTSVNPNTNPYQNASITITPVRTEDAGRCSYTMPSIAPSPPGGGGGGGSTQVQCNELRLDQNEIVRGLSSQTFSATVYPSNFNGTTIWRHIKNNTLVSSSTSSAISSRVTFNNIDSNSTITVRATPPEQRAACSKILTMPPAPSPRGKLYKDSFEVISRGNVIKIGQTAEFQVTFVPRTAMKTVTIYDSMRDKLYGEEGGEISLVRGEYNGKDFKVQKKTTVVSTVAECSNRLNVAATCYEGNPFTTAGITIRNLDDETILITYKGKLTKSKINSQYCKNSLDPRFCGEKFTNEVTDTLRNIKHSYLYTPCPYLLTQGIGDVILEEDLSVGSDILSCFGIPNIEGPTITPTPPPTQTITRTGLNDILNIPTHGQCEKSNFDELSQPTGYRNPLKSISSAICEMQLSLIESITPPSIRSNVLENITRVTRYNNNLGIGADFNVANLNAPIPLTKNSNTNFEIYKLKNGNLIIDTIQQPVGAGARTYVVENGDLIINGNIKYADTVYDLANTKKIPSIAFIVINGNIKIAPNVTQLDGIYATFAGGNPGEKLRNGGKVLGTADSEKALKINGSIYGDIEPLFESRSYIGSASRGQGTITINYDGRIFYNMPPGLSEILDVSQEQVAR